MTLPGPISKTWVQADPASGVTGTVINNTDMTAFQTAINALLVIAGNLRDASNHAAADFDPAGSAAAALVSAENAITALNLGSISIFAATDYVATGQKGTPGGVATLDLNGVLTATQLPSLRIVKTVAVANQTAMLALPVNDDAQFAIRADNANIFLLPASADPTQLANWIDLTPSFAAYATTAALTTEANRAQNAEATLTTNVAANATAIIKAQSGSRIVHAGNITGATVLDLSAGTVFTATLTGNATISFTNWPTGIEVEPMLLLTQDGTGSRTVTWTGVTWLPSGTPPTLSTTPAALDVIGLLSPDSGTTVIGHTGFGPALAVETTARTSADAALAASTTARSLIPTATKVGSYAAAAGDFVMVDPSSRVVADGVLNSTTTVTSATAAFVAGDVGRVVAGTGIPSNTTIASVTNGTTVVLSAAATATATGVSLTFGGAFTVTAPTLASGVRWGIRLVTASPNAVTASTATGTFDSNGTTTLAMATGFALLDITFAGNAAGTQWVATTTGKPNSYLSSLFDATGAAATAQTSAVGAAAALAIVFGA